MGFKAWLLVLGRRGAAEPQGSSVYDLMGLGQAQGDPTGDWDTHHEESPHLKSDQGESLYVWFMMEQAMAVVGGGTWEHWMSKKGHRSSWAPVIQKNNMLTGIQEWSKTSSEQGEGSLWVPARSAFPGDTAPPDHSTHRLAVPSLTLAQP